MSLLRLLTFSTLYPNDAAPNHGIFVETRLRHLVRHQPVTSTVLAPVPYFPFRASLFGAWSRHARAPLREERHGLVVHHPRYIVIPRLGMSVAPFLLYQAAARAMRRLLAEGHAFDAIDAHYLYPDGVAAVWLGRRFRLPVVVTARGSDVTQLPDHAVPRRLIERTIANADALIAVSEALKCRLIALGADPGRVTVLRNGVDAAMFRPLPRDEARAELGLARPTLLSVGHLIERKGHHRVIAAMPMLPDLDLVIVGEGPERARLAALIARLGLGGRVCFAGAVPQAELPTYYSVAEALVLASSREGWANVLLEAMACGTPVVASDVWGNPEVVRCRAAGIIAPANTPDAIASAVRGLLAAPPSRGATRAYAERFGWEATGAGQVSVFEAVLARCGRQGGPCPQRECRRARGMMPPGRTPCARDQAFDGRSLS
jgi:glycosyltransferase involved in cell wall biosynthesis